MQQQRLPSTRLPSDCSEVVDLFGIHSAAAPPVPTAPCRAALGRPWETGELPCWETSPLHPPYFACTLLHSEKETRIPSSIFVTHSCKGVASSKGPSADTRQPRAGSTPEGEARSAPMPETGCPHHPRCRLPRITVWLLTSCSPTTPAFNCIIGVWSKPQRFEYRVTQCQ